MKLSLISSLLLLTLATLSPTTVRGSAPTSTGDCLTSSTFAYDLTSYSLVDTNTYTFNFAYLVVVGNGLACNHLTIYDFEIVLVSGLTSGTSSKHVVEYYLMEADSTGT